jgi:hypothetical protein
MVLLESIHQHPPTSGRSVHCSLRCWAVGVTSLRGCSPCVPDSWAVVSLSTIELRVPQIVSVFPNTPFPAEYAAAALPPPPSCQEPQRPLSRHSCIVLLPIHESYLAVCGGGVERVESSSESSVPGHCAVRMHGCGPSKRRGNAALPLARETDAGLPSLRHHNAGLLMAPGRTKSTYWRRNG